MAESHLGVKGSPPETGMDSRSAGFQPAGPQASSLLDRGPLGGSSISARNIRCIEIMFLLCSHIVDFAKSDLEAPIVPTAEGRWHLRGYLPHFGAANTTQHIVFRLDDALPATFLLSLDRAPLWARMRMVEKVLDAGVGSRVLGNAITAELVVHALTQFDSERYSLVAWCVMPSNVHVPATQFDGWPLACVVHGWKSFTAQRANQQLGRSGRFWAPEYFDRAMRNAAHVEMTTSYFEANPVAAGLCRVSEDWPWGSAAWKAAIRRAGSPRSRDYSG